MYLRRLILWLNKSSEISSKDFFLWRNVFCVCWYGKFRHAGMCAKHVAYVTTNPVLRWACYFTTVFTIE